MQLIPRRAPAAFDPALAGRRRIKFSPVSTQPDDDPESASPLALVSAQTPAPRPVETSGVAVAEPNGGLRIVPRSKDVGAGVSADKAALTPGASAITPALRTTLHNAEADALPEEVALQQAQNRPLKKEPRWRAALETALQAIGQELGAHPATDWAGLARGVGAAGAGAIVGAAKPTTPSYFKREYDIHKAEGDLDRAQQREENRAKIRFSNARATQQAAQPGSKQAAADAKAQKDAQAAVRADLKLHPHPFDPNDADDAAFLQRAHAAGVYVDAAQWGRGGKNDRQITYVDPDAPTQTRTGRYNTFTGEVEPLTLAGAPVQHGYVAPIHPDTELTAPQEEATRARRVTQAEQHRHNVVNEGQGVRRIGQADTRIGLARTRQTGGGATATQMNTRLARAAELNRKLEDEKNRAAHPPQSISGQPTSDAYRHAYSERHKQAAAGFAQQITDAHGDLYETGTDGDGWAYAKPRPGAVPNAGARAGGAQTFTEGDVRARARAAHKDEDAAVAAARAAKLIP
jgi:hypothetical protein